MITIIVAASQAVTIVGCRPSESLSPSTAGPSVPASASPTAASAAYLDPAQPVETRVQDLLGRMTIEEKIGQMTLVEKDSIDPAGVTDALVGGVLSGGGGNPPRNTPEGWYEMVGGFLEAALATRLAIPMIYGVDAVHGHNNVVGATIFPHNVGLGAGGDPALVVEVGRATAIEMNATGVRWDFGPVLAVPQDVRWGRTYEGYGEDPALVEELGSAFIRGLQGADLKADDTAVATAKHFVGDGGTVWGTSTTEGYSIDQGVTDVDDETLEAIHLRPYREAIAAGARTVMASFSSTPDGKVHGDKHLLTDVLKTDLGFTGFVVSDWGGVDQVTADYDTAVATSITAGIDMVMVPYEYERFQAAMERGLENDAIAQDRVDDAVRRILRVKFEMGLFERPMPVDDRFDIVGSDDHRALARRAVAASAVLLKTSPGLSPLIPAEGPVLLAGEGADDIGIQSGGWTISWQGEEGSTTVGTTLRAALEERLGGRVVYHADADFTAVDLAGVGILVLAERPYAEGEGDSATLELAAEDLALVSRMAERIDPLVVVVLSGRPVMLDAILPAADAVVAAWLPGTEGAGLADLLLGEQPFGGRTPYTWPATPDDAPRTGREACDGAVFPAGYGLDGSGKLLGSPACR